MPQLDHIQLDHIYKPLNHLFIISPKSTTNSHKNIFPKYIFYILFFKLHLYFLNTYTYILNTYTYNNPH